MIAQTSVTKEVLLPSEQRHAWNLRASRDCSRGDVPPVGLSELNRQAPTPTSAPAARSRPRRRSVPRCCGSRGTTLLSPARPGWRSSPGDLEPGLAAERNVLNGRVENKRTAPPRGMRRDRLRCASSSALNRGGLPCGPRRTPRRRQRVRWPGGAWVRTSQELLFQRPYPLS